MRVSNVSCVISCIQPVMKVTATEAALAYGVWQADLSESGAGSGYGSLRLIVSRMVRECHVISAASVRRWPVLPFQPPAAGGGTAWTQAEAACI